MKMFSAIILFMLLSPEMAGAANQNDINQELQQGGRIHLPAGTYILTDLIILQSNTILEGEPGTVITIPDHAGWPAWKPLISGNRVQNVTIRNLEINANSNGNSETPHGAGFYNCIYMIDCDNVQVYNCTFHNSLGDGLRTKRCENIKFYNNLVYRLGHEGFYGIDSQYIECFSNRITTRTNSGLRIWNSANVRFHDNVIDAQLDAGGGDPGIQIEDSKGTVSNVEIYNNVLNRTWGKGVWLVAYDAGVSNTQGVLIHHNLFYEIGQSYNIPSTGGIVNDGFQDTQIYNNIFDGVKNNAFRNQAGGQGTIIKDNVFTNTAQHTAISQTGTGYAIADLVGANLSVVNNCFYNNEKGDVYQTSFSNSDFRDPKTNQISSGWIWTGSTWTCNYVKPMGLGSVPLTTTIRLQLMAIIYSILYCTTFVHHF
jgi:parallel beta-helix repeat protein